MAVRQKDLFGDQQAERASLRDKVFNDIIWTHGVALLLVGGMSNSQARSLLGKKANDIGREGLARGVLSAFGGDGKHMVKEPVAYIAALKPRVLEEIDAPVREVEPASDYSPEFFDNEDGAH